jgi:hypothetical protein
MSIKYLVVTTAQQMLSTELNALASGSGIVQVTGTNAAYDNSSNLAFWGDFELNVTFGSAPAADASVELYLVPAFDGTNYETTVDGASPLVDLNSLIGVFDLEAVTTAQRRVIRGVPLPPTLFKLYIKNTSGVVFPATGTVVRMSTYCEQ